MLQSAKRDDVRIVEVVCIMRVGAIIALIVIISSANPIPVIMANQLTGPSGAQRRQEDGKKTRDKSGKGCTKEGRL